MTGKRQQPAASRSPRTTQHSFSRDARGIASSCWAAIVTCVLLLSAIGAAQDAADPATAPSTQSATAPATEPAGEVATAPATEPATEPATAPATQSATAASQPATAPVATRPVDPPPRNVSATRPMGNGKLSMDFRDASLRSVLEYFSEAAGLIIIEDAKLDGRVTVLSRQPMELDEAIDLLDTVLRQKDLAAIRTGRTLKIVTVAQAKKELIPVRSGANPDQIPSNDRIITQIIPIRYADAIKLKADIAPLVPTTADVATNASSNTIIITGTQSTIRRVAEIIQAIDVHMSEVSQVAVFPLKYANAANAARLINEIFREDASRTGGQTRGRAFTMPGMPDFGGGDGGRGRGNATAEEGQRATRVVASSDDRTNTLVVSAAPDVLTVIKGLVEELDSDTTAQQAVFIYRLKNAQAKNLEGVLNSIFGFTGTTGTASRTTGTRTTGTTGTTSPFGSRTGSSGSGRSGTGTGTSGRTGTGTGTAGRTGTGNTGRTGTAAPGRTTGRTGAAGLAASAADLAGQVYVVADEDTNSLVVTTGSANFDRVKAIIGDLDRAVPQVLIKVLIAEVTHDNTLDVGTEFSVLNLRSGGTKGQRISTDFGVSAQNSGFIFRLEEENVSAAVRAIAGVAKLDVLSRPYILTSDNQQASIMVGQEVPFITSSRITETGQTINTIQYDDIGIILNVTPHINPQGLVTMDVAPEISTLTGETVPISDTVAAPVFAKRSAQSRVAIRDGQTIVIGGLMEDRLTKSVDKVPLLGDIPVLGLLFRRTIERKTKTELLIFLTPHVALVPDDLEGMSEQEKQGAKIIPDAVEKGAFEEHLKGMKRGAAASRPAGYDNTTVDFIPATRPNDLDKTPVGKSGDQSPADKSDDGTPDDRTPDDDRGSRMRDDNPPPQDFWPEVEGSSGGRDE